MAQRRVLILVANIMAFAVPFLVGLTVHQQGFNLLDDGLWLLGAKLVSEGGVLYRDLFTIYGPVRFLLLAPFLVLLGQSVWTLAVFKACLDGAAGLFGYRLARRLGAGWWAVFVPLGVVALGPVLPRYLAAVFFAAFAGDVLVKPWNRRSGFVLGVAWGTLGLFGLDMAGYGGVILVMGLVCAPRACGQGWVQFPGPWMSVGTGWVAILGAAAVVALFQGVMTVAAWDTVVYPVTRFREAMGISWWDSFRDSPWLKEVFAGHYTGEILEAAWPGQSILRALGLRAMFILAWVLPVAGMVAARRWADLRLALLAALGVAGWATLAARGDVEHLRLIWFCVLLPVPVILGRLSGWVAIGLAAVVLMALVPLGMEQVWLAAHLNRPGLGVWERPTAGIRLETGRRDILEALCSELDRGPGRPVLVWPAQPGLQFVLDAPLATPQVTLLPGEVSDPAAVLADLESSRPAVAVLGPAWGQTSGVRTLQEASPGMWSYLRNNYLLVDEYAHGGETFKTVARVGGGRAAVEAAPLSRRLPGTAHYLKTHMTTVLGPGTAVAQSFKVRDFDLAGVAVMFTAPGPFPYPISLTLKFVALGGPSADSVLAELPIRIELDQNVQKKSFSFGPLAGTAGREVVMEITGNRDNGAPFALMWHRHHGDPGGETDFYPAGRAFFNGKPAEGDLYFITF